MITDSGAGQIPILRLLHTIHAVRDMRAARELYYDVLAAISFGERFHPKEDRDMTLMYVSDYMVELMSPRDPEALDRGFARFVKKYGESYHSVELQVADADAAKAACLARGFTLNTVYDDFFFIDLKSAGGIIIEVVGRPMRNDPANLSGWNPDWMKGHRSGLRRLHAIAFLPRDIARALELLTAVFDGRIESDETVSFPQAARRVAVRMGAVSMGADRLVLFSPLDDGPGPLTDFLAKPSSGIYGLVWEVEELPIARAVYESLGVRMEPATLDPEGLAIRPEDMMGARHEFVAPPR